MGARPLLRAFAIAGAAAWLGAAAAGHAVELRAAGDTSRIVSIGGAITEILYALGLERRIVGVDTTSLYPREALRTKPNVGYMRQLSPEGVLSLNPSLILAIEGAGPKEAIAVVETAGIPLVRVPDRFTGQGIIEKIGHVAAATGTIARGACLAKAVSEDLAALAKLRKRIERPVRIMFLLSLVDGRALVAGRNTAADGIIRLTGAANAITDYDGYKPINDEAIIAAGPDVVLAMQREGQPLDSAAVFAHPGFALTPAAKARAFMTMDGLYLLGFGPRAALAARDLAVALNPALAATRALPSERGAPLATACRE